MGSESDENLISKIAEKDEKAFIEFVRRYQSRIINLCFRLTADRENAEDVAQDVFLQIYHEADKFRGSSKVSTWVYRIAYNQSLNFLRKLKRQGLLKKWRSLSKNHSPGTDELPALSQHSPEVAFERKQEREFLDKALDSLPESQKIVFILHHLEGCSYQEIADILLTSVASVESRIHRAKEKLCKKILSRLKGC